MGVLAMRSSVALALAIKYHLVLSWRPSGNVRTLTGPRCNHLVLSRRPSGDARTLTRTNQRPGCYRHWVTILVGLPSLSGYHRCRVTIVVGLPSLLGYHHCRAAIVVGLSVY
jgi:hypothetical protein